MRCSNAGFRAAHRRRLHRHHHGTRRGVLVVLVVRLFLGSTSLSFSLSLSKATCARRFGLLGRYTTTTQFLSFVFVFFPRNPFSFLRKSEGKKRIFEGRKDTWHQTITWQTILRRFFFSRFFVSLAFFLYSYDERLFGITTNWNVIIS